MSIYVTDTHPLVFFATRDRRRLSRRAWDVFEQAENGEVLILVPAPALWEVAILERLGHIALDAKYEDWTRRLFGHPCFECVPLDADIIAEARNCNVNQDIFDAAIIATARLKDVPLITKDIAVTDSGLVDVFW